MNTLIHKIKYISLLLITGLLLTTISCDKMVEVDLPNDKMNSKDVYEDITTTKSALNYIYSRLRDTTILTFNIQGKSSVLSLFTDELTYSGSTENLIFINDIDQVNLSNTSLWWDNAYKDLYTINAFIEGVNSSTTLKDADKEQLLGEAYTLRALYFQTLAQIYGNIPYTTTTDYIVNTTIGKTDYNTVLTLIEKDLLIALDLLDYTYRTPEKIYINKAVTELLLTENYLLQKRYDQAQIYAQNIIDNSIYQIENDLDKVFLKDSKSTLLQISPVNLPRTTPQVSTYLLTVVNNSLSLAPTFYNTFDTNDLRKTHWVNNLTINGITYHQPFKYKNKLNNIEEYGVFYRLEEAYFYLAEALAYQEKTSVAAEVINIIRSKRGLSDLPLNLSKDLFITELLREANKEFFTEGGHRFLDLKRNGRIQDLALLKPTWKTYNDLFPIPEKQTLINKNLLPNNPGY